MGWRRGKGGVLPKPGLFHIVPGMSWLSKAVRRAARSKVLRHAASAAAGVLLPAVATRGLSIAKSLGARIVGNRPAEQDSKSVKAAVAKLGSMTPPAVIEGAKNPTKPAVIEAWPKVRKSSRRSTRQKAKPASGSRASSAGNGKSGSSGAAKQPKGSAPKKPSPGGKATKSGSSGKKRAAPFKSGNANAAGMKAASASWKKMSDAQKKAAGGWRGHVSKTLGGK